METLKAVFPAPKGCTKEQLEQICKENGNKFLGAMDLQGWVLRSPLNFYQDFGHSRKDPNDNHYVAVGQFSPDFRKEKREVMELPDRVVKKLIKKFGDKVKVL